jgi:thiamine-phosphate pyrophosphorylase
MINKPFYPLMLVTNRQHTPMADYLQFVKKCATSGITSVQLREKKQSYASLVLFGKKLKHILDPLNIPLIINDDIKLALELDAGGVHLGQTDGDPELARKTLGPNKIIGVSIDSEENLIKANQLPIDYVGIGAIYPTTSKTNVNTFWGIPGLQRLVPLSKHPIIAIGGLNENNAADVILSGAHGIAVINALHDTDNPCQKARNLRHIVDNRGQPYAS